MVVPAWYAKQIDEQLEKNAYWSPPSVPSPTDTFVSSPLTTSFHTPSRKKIKVESSLNNKMPINHPLSHGERKPRGQKTDRLNTQIQSHEQPSTDGIPKPQSKRKPRGQPSTVGTNKPHKRKPQGKPTTDGTPKPQSKRKPRGEHSDAVNTKKNNSGNGRRGKDFKKTVVSN